MSRQNNVRGAGAAARPSLAPRTRQELSAVRAEAQKLEDYYGVGTIHAVRYVLSGNKLEAEIILNRDRERVNASEGGEGADEASGRAEASDMEVDAAGAKGNGRPPTSGYPSKTSRTAAETTAAAKARARARPPALPVPQPPPPTRAPTRCPKSSLPRQCAP